MDILTSNKKKRNTDTFNNLDESLENYAEATNKQTKNQHQKQRKEKEEISKY